MNEARAEDEGRHCRRCQGDRKPQLPRGRGRFDEARGGSGPCLDLGDGSLRLCPTAGDVSVEILRLRSASRLQFVPNLGGQGIPGPGMLRLGELALEAVPALAGSLKALTELPAVDELRCQPGLPA